MSVIKNATIARIKQLCNERGIVPNDLANRSGLTPSTVYSIFKEERKNISLVTLKIICDGLEITLAEFFSTEEFDNLEQELK